MPAPRPSSFARFTPTVARGGLLRRMLARASDQLVDLTHRTLGDDIDDCLNRVMKNLNEAGYDSFGADPYTLRNTMAVVTYLYRLYFRVEAHGLDKVPPGRVLLVANHSGQIPLDGAMIATSMALDVDPPRMVRSMVEKWSATLPFFSVWFPRVGQVIGSPENARRLLERDEVLLVFPEGVRGISKTFDKRYQLTDFGLGFMRLALETNTPIVPVAVIGAEEQMVSVGNLKSLSQMLNLPALPLIPQFFLGMPMPLPTKYRLYFGEPLHFSGDPDDDDAVIEEKVWVVKATIQSMVNRGLKLRRAIFW